jgi:hypothetical protein
MPEAISNTSALLYLYRGGALKWPPQLFNETWIPKAVVLELEKGRRRGYDEPNPSDYVWPQIVEPHAVHRNSSHWTWEQENWQRWCWPWRIQTSCTAG